MTTYLVVPRSTSEIFLKNSCDNCEQNLNEIIFLYSFSLKPKKKSCQEAKVCHKNSTDSEKKREFHHLVHELLSSKLKVCFGHKIQLQFDRKLCLQLAKLGFNYEIQFPKLHLQLQSKWALCFLPSPPEHELFLSSVWKLVFLWKRMTWVFHPPPKSIREERRCEVKLPFEPVSTP